MFVFDTNTSSFFSMLTVVSFSNFAITLGDRIFFFNPKILHEMLINEPLCQQILARKTTFKKNYSNKSFLVSTGHYSKNVCS